MNSSCIYVLLFLVAILSLFACTLFIMVRQMEEDLKVIEINYNTSLELYKALKNSDFTKTEKLEHFSEK